MADAIDTTDVLGFFLIGGALLYAYARSVASNNSAIPSSDGTTSVAPLYFGPADPLTSLADNFTAIVTGAQNVGLTTVAAVTGQQLTRGLRNNNPGNIRSIAGDTWQGQTGSDGQYAIFDTMIYGVRAMARVLTNYNARGVNTVRKIISTWAPPNENETPAYIQDVSSRLSVSPDDVLDLQDDQTMSDLIDAIIIHENSYDPTSNDDRLQAIALSHGGVSA